MSLRPAALFLRSVIRIERLLNVLPGLPVPICTVSDSCTNVIGNYCGWDGSTDYCRYKSGCPTGQQSYGTCCYQADSPIVVDLSGKGFSLTDAKNGVSFPITDTDTPHQVAWTSASSDNAWLVLDRNKNGKIDNGTELFGNFTPQPDPPTGAQRNGFLALAVYDQPENGGNGDGLISEADAIYADLRLWVDKNHNGKSEPDELFTLREKEIVSISLTYSLSRRKDDFGNVFRYRSRVFGGREYPGGRFAYDVYLAEYLPGGTK